MPDDERHLVMQRRTGLFSSWKPFSYVVRSDSLLEYKLGTNPLKADPKVVYDLRGCIVEDAAAIDGNALSILLHTRGGKSLFLRCSNAEDQKFCLNGFKNLTPTLPVSSATPSVVGSAASSIHEVDTASIASSGESKKTMDSKEWKDMTPAELEAALPILTFVESFTDALIICNPNGIMIGVNSAAERLFGFQPGTARGQPLTSLMPEPFKSRHDGYLFRHEKFGRESLIGKPRVLRGERQETKETFPIQISLGKLPLPGFFVATMREVSGDQPEMVNEE